MTFEFDTRRIIVERMIAVISHSLPLMALSLPSLYMHAFDFFITSNLHGFTVNVFLQKWKKVLLRKATCKVI